MSTITEKEKLIDEVMSTVYKDDDPKYDCSNYTYLETLSVGELDALLADYYASH